MIVRRITALLRANKLVGALVGVALVSLMLGYGARSVMVSGTPAEVAATPPPPPGLITASVEQRQITARVTGRAEISVSDQIAVEPAVPEGTLDAVVTEHVPKQGATIKSGAVILEISGRPIFALEGRPPTYRSMGPGSSGPDVRQLRAALNRLGLHVGSPKSDQYDAALASAVRALYLRAGYQEPTSGSSPGESAIEDARDALADARSAHNQVKAGRSAAGDEEMDPLEAKQQLAAAERGVTRAKRALVQAE